MIGLLEPDIVRAVVLAFSIAIMGIIVAVARGVSGAVVVPAWPLRLILGGMFCFMAAVSYVLARLLGSPVGEPISLLSIFATAGLVLKLAGLVWLLRDRRAFIVDQDSERRSTDCDDEDYTDERRHP